MKATTQLFYAKTVVGNTFVTDKILKDYFFSGNEKRRVVPESYNNQIGSQKMTS